MYIGTAALAMPVIQKAREKNNGLMGTCALGAGAIISIGLGKMASSIFNRTVDKVVDFIDDVKPKENSNEKSSVVSEMDETEEE